MQTIEIDSIRLGERIRTTADDIDELADDIKRHGLIHPIVVTPNLTLVAGGRRLMAVRKLGFTKLWHGYTCHPSKPGYVTTDELDDDATLTEIELVENLQRKDIDWRDLVRGVYTIHRLHYLQAARRGESWTTEMTGERLGGWQAPWVGKLLRLHDFLDHPVMQNVTKVTDAIREMYNLKADEAVSELAKRVVSVTTSASTDDVEQPASSSQPIDVSSLVHHGDCLEVLATWPAGCVDHILTDPPYAIEMSNLAQGRRLTSVARVAKEHDVVYNERLFADMFRPFFHVLGDYGYCVVFCDATRWHVLCDHAAAAGFVVQRWPFVWTKPIAKNEMAEVNMTKVTEFALVCHKPKAVLARNGALNWFHCSSVKDDINPFAKPLELWTYLLDCISLRGQTILDPFAGSGSCLVACLKSGRKPVGIEINETQYSHAVVNLQQLLK